MVSRPISKIVGPPKINEVRASGDAKMGHPYHKKEICGSCGLDPPNWLMPEFIPFCIVPKLGSPIGQTPMNQQPYLPTETP
jgi:hypothetical protein